MVVAAALGDASVDAGIRVMHSKFRILKVSHLHVYVQRYGTRTAEKIAQRVGKQGAEVIAKTMADFDTKKGKRISDVCLRIRPLARAPYIPQQQTMIMMTSCAVRDVVVTGNAASIEVHHQSPHQGPDDRRDSGVVSGTHRGDEPDLAEWY